MPIFNRRLAQAMACAAVALLQGEALAQAEPLKLDATLQQPAGGADVPTFVTADSIEGVSESELEASGRAEVRRGGTTLYADQIRYIQGREEVLATGNVRLLSRGNEIWGPRVRLRLDEHRGIFEQPEFKLAPVYRDLLEGEDLRSSAEGQTTPPIHSRGMAQDLRMEGEDQFRLTESRFTTCKPGVDDWYINSRELHLDTEREVGTAYDFSLSFLGATTPELPYIEFPLNNKRKSGLLPPTLSMGGDRGLDVSVPYYWNIAPNYDATLVPRYMEKRGMQMGTEFRYLQKDHQGSIDYEYLSDREDEQDRWGMGVHHRANWHNGWTGLVNYGKVSDDDYFRDLSSNISVATRNHINQEGVLRYTGEPWWNAVARVQKFQVLQDPQAPIEEPYERVPQLALNVLNQDIQFVDIGLNGEFVAFEHPTKVTGRRFTAYPSVALPFGTAGAYVKPKVGWHSTWYELSDEFEGGDAPTRSLPIASLDSGMFFERDMNWLDRSWLQTLEPRLYYLKVPYRDQSDIPLFDTAIKDFNFTQIFSENMYSGGDRIAEANQLTLGVTSRFLMPETGQEIVRATVGQRYYFGKQRVVDSAVDETVESDASAVLGDFSGRIAPNWSVGTAVQYDFSETEIERLQTGFRYSPAPASILNLAYRYTNEEWTRTSSSDIAAAIRGFDVSAQWPLAQGWYGLARYAYDLEGSQAVEQLLGVEYNADCWILRVVGHKFATATDKESNVFFIQLELNGLSRLGSNPLSTLRRNIPGYTQTNVIWPDEGSGLDRSEGDSPWAVDERL